MTAEAIAKIEHLMTRHVDLVNRALHSRPLTDAENIELAEIEEAVDLLTEATS